MNKKKLNIIALAITALVAALALYATTLQNTETAIITLPNEVPSTTDMVDAGPGITLTVELAAEAGTTLCPSGGIPEVRIWDTNGDLWDSPAPLFVPTAHLGRVINGTVWCRMGTGMWEGFVSPSLAASSIGSEAESIGVHAYVDGEEHPASICWDTAAPHTDPIFHRIQFRADATGDSTGCYAGTL